MKKLLVLVLFCCIFTLGCNKADEVNSEKDSITREALDMGMKQSDLGNLEAALATYTKAIEQVKDNANLYVDRGRVKSELGDLDGALDDINKGLALSEEGWIYAERAVVYKMKEENKLALEDYKKALSLDPSMDWVRDVIKKLESQPEGN